MSGSPRRRAGTWIVVALLVAAAAWWTGGGAAVGQSSAPRPVTVPPTDPPAPPPPTTPVTLPPQRLGDPETGLLHLVEASPAVVAEGIYEARIGVDDAVSPWSTELVVNVYDRVLDRDHFADTLEGESLGTALATIGPSGLWRYERDVNGTVRLLLDLNDGALPAEEGQVRLRRPGVYPVLFELRTRDGDVLDRLTTHLVRLPDPGSAEPLEIGLGLGVGAPPGQRADGTIGFSAPERAQLAALVDALTRSSAIPLSLQVVPETLRAMALSGDPTDRDLATRLLDRQDTRTLLEAAYVRIDHGGMVAAGLNDEREQLRDLGRRVVTEIAGTEPRGRTWMADGALSASALRVRVDDGVREVVVPEAVIDGDVPTDAPVELVVDGLDTTVTAMVVDADLQSRFAVDDDPVLAAERLLAELSVIALADPEASRALALTPPDGWTPDGVYLQTLLDGLAGNPLLRPTALAEVFDRDPATDLLGRPVEATLVDRLPDLPEADLEQWRLTRERLDAFASMVVDAEGQAALSDLEGLLLPSLSADLTAQDKERYWVTVRDTVDRHLDAIEAPPTRSYTLTAAEDEIPLRFRNNGELALSVQVRLESDKLDFPEGEVLTVTLPPGQVVDHAVAVEAKSPGAFPVTVTLLTADGSMPLAEGDLRLRSIVLSGLGVILTVAFGGLLALWWVLDHRARRRARLGAA